MVVRAVDVHQPLAQVSQSGERDGRTIDELAIGPGASEGAFYDKLVVLARFQSIFFQEGLHWSA